MTEKTARCELRYPFPGKRDEPFPVTYRCGLQSGHDGACGPLNTVVEQSSSNATPQQEENWKALVSRLRFLVAERRHVQLGVVDDDLIAAATMIEQMAGHIDSLIPSASTATSTSKRELLERVTKELNLDLRDPFTLIFANACALSDACAELRHERNVLQKICAERSDEIERRAGTYEVRIWA